MTTLLLFSAVGATGFPVFPNARTKTRTHVSQTCGRTVSDLTIQSGIPSPLELCPIGSGTELRPWDQGDTAVTQKTMDAQCKAAHVGRHQGRGQEPAL